MKSCPITWDGQYDKIIGRASVSDVSVRLEILDKDIMKSLETTGFILSSTLKIGDAKEIIQFHLSPVPVNLGG